MKYGKLIGTGFTADVYEWEDGKVLKLFKKGYPQKAIKKELENARAIADLDFLKPGVYGLVNIGEQSGIIYDRVEGQPLLDWVINTGELEQCAEYMAGLHKKILANKVSNVPDYRDFLENNILNILADSRINKEEMLERLAGLPEGDTLCHGDFHPGNIFISDGEAVVIDFMNICRGVQLYDVARTIFLIEYAPIPAEAENMEILTKFKRRLTDLYLEKMDISRDMLADYLEIIKAARIGEC